MLCLLTQILMPYSLNDNYNQKHLLVLKMGNKIDIPHEQYFDL